MSNVVIAMADQEIEEDEEWYKATCTVKLAGCDQGSRIFTVNLDKKTWQSNKVPLAVVGRMLLNDIVVCTTRLLNL